MTPEIPSYWRIRMRVLHSGRGVFPLTVTPLMTYFIVFVATDRSKNVSLMKMLKQRKPIMRMGRARPVRAQDMFVDWMIGWKIGWKIGYVQGQRVVETLGSLSNPDFSILHLTWAAFKLLIPLWNLLALSTIEIDSINQFLFYSVLFILIQRRGFTPLPAALWQWHDPNPLHICNPSF